ncbi:MAG: hypothetical protein WBA67_07570 [Jannaschia sp.]
MRYLLLIAALALPTAGHSHDILRVAPQDRDAWLWLDGPKAGTAGGARIRLISHGDGRTFALSVNQYDAYQRIYARRLTELSRHMTVHTAIPRARNDAFHAIAGSSGPTPVYRTAPLKGARVTPGS